MLQIIWIWNVYCLLSLFLAKWFPNKRLATVNSLCVNNYLKLERFRTKNAEGDQLKHRWTMKSRALFQKHTQNPVKHLRWSFLRKQLTPEAINCLTVFPPSLLIDWVMNASLYLIPFGSLWNKSTVFWTKNWVLQKRCYDG